MDNPYHDSPNPTGSPAETLLFLKEVKAKVEEAIDREVHVSCGLSYIGDRTELSVRISDFETGDQIGGINMTEEGILSAYDTQFVVNQLVLICREAANVSP